jgi:hypothetical protein
LRAQVRSGRYKDFSAAIQDAAWHYFVEQPSVFAEYGVTAEEVETAAARDVAAVRRDRKAGKLKAWKPWFTSARGMSGPGASWPLPSKPRSTPLWPVWKWASAGHMRIPDLGCEPSGHISSFFEFRVGLGLRVLFLSDGGDLFLCFVGNHEQVRAFIKQGN